MAVALVPAAGRSRRMGRPKLLLPFGDTTLLGAVVDALRQGGAEDVLAVLRSDDEALRGWAHQHGVLTAVNPEPERGMLSSIWAGLEVLGGAEDLAAREVTFLVCPGDLPLLRPDTVRRVLDSLAEGAGRLIVPVYEGKRGHPLAIAPALLPEISRLDPGIGLKQLLDLRTVDLFELSVVDAGVVREVNTPADYETLTGRRRE